MQLARVGVRVIVLVIDVVCLMLVLSARVGIHAVFVQFSYPIFCSKRKTLDNSSNWPNDCFRRFPRSISAGFIVAVMSQMKDATRNLANSTKTRKSFATNFGNKLDLLDS